MKNCLKGISVLALSFVLGVTGVNAANLTVNPNSCKDKTVYTNYYYLSDAFFNWEGHDITSLVDDYTTLGYFGNVTPVEVYDVSGNKGFFGNEIISEQGTIPVVKSNATPYRGVESISLTDFWNDFKRGNLSGVTSFSNGVKYVNNYLTSHSWSKYNPSTNRIEAENNSGVNINSFSTYQLEKASIYLSPDKITTTYLNTSTNTRSVIQITRSYSKLNRFNVSSNFYYADHTPIDWVNTNAQGVTSTAHIYAQPALHYIQYCVKANNNNNNQTLKYLDFDKNAGANNANVTGMPNTQSYYDYTVISNVTPSLPGYTFKGWAITPTGNVVYMPNDTYNGSSRVLYAVWEKNNVVGIYTVSYKANTTDTVYSLPSSTVSYVGESTKISSNIPKRNGYTFLGWSTDSNATSADNTFKPGVTYESGKDLVLYAIWKKDDSTVPDSPKTGVEDYILPFGSTVALAGAGLALLKKKQSFLQF